MVVSQCKGRRSLQLPLLTRTRSSRPQTRLKQAYYEMSKKNFAIKETSVGFVFNSHALLFEQSLANDMLPARQIVHDWMHTYLVKGCFHPLLLTFIQNWNVPNKEKFRSANKPIPRLQHSNALSVKAFPCIQSLHTGRMILPQQLRKPFLQTFCI